MIIPKLCRHFQIRLVMGDSRPEGERNFWDDKQAVTATNKANNKIKAQQAALAMEAAGTSLSGEGGSDAFSSTRHVFNTPESQQVSRVRYKKVRKCVFMYRQTREPFGPYHTVKVDKKR